MRNSDSTSVYEMGQDAEASKQEQQKKNVELRQEELQLQGGVNSRPIYKD